MAWLLILCGLLLGSVVEAPVMGGVLGAIVSLFAEQRRLARENEALREQVGELKKLREAPTPVRPQPRATPRATPRAADVPVKRAATRTEPTPVAPPVDAAAQSGFAAMMSQGATPMTSAEETAAPTEEARTGFADLMAQMAAPSAETAPRMRPTEIAGSVGDLTPSASLPVAPRMRPTEVAGSVGDLTPSASLPVATGEPTPFAAPIAVAPGEVGVPTAVTPVDPFAQASDAVSVVTPGEVGVPTAVTPVDPFAGASDGASAPTVVTPVEPTVPTAVTAAVRPEPTAGAGRVSPLERERAAWAERAVAEPDLATRAFAAARGWLFGGNPVLRIGVVVLFLGFAFLLRYASERGMVPIEARYAGVAAAAMALLGLGWRLRERKREYALILQGTGVATLYLTIFAAIRLHPLLPAKPGLGLLIAVTLALTILAVVQNARGLAAVAAIGGFAAPILASTGSGNHVALFTYLAVLNAGLLAIAWFKAWRLINTIGFFGTFGIGLAWGLRAYEPALYASTQPFLALFFVMYVAIGLLFARRKLRDAGEAPTERAALLAWSRRQADYVDGLIVFGPPTVGFGLQFAVVEHLELGAALSAAALGLFYMALAWALKRRAGARALLLVESCLALGVVFGTLAIPLGLDARWTSAAWAVEAAGLYWLALRQGRPLARVFALAVQAGAAVAYLGDVDLALRSSGRLVRGSPLGAGMLAGSLLFAHDRLRRTAAELLRGWERPWCLPLLAWTGLAFAALIAPLCLREQGTAIAWATGGLVTLFVGLRIRSRSYLAAAMVVQLLGGALFMADIDRSAGMVGGVLASGWRGLMLASWIGLALIAGMVLAARHPWVREDRAILVGLSVTLLIGLGLVNLAVLFVLPWATAAAVWGASGLVIVWIGLVLQQRSAFVFGMLLQGLAGAVFLNFGPDLAVAEPGARPLAHIGFWTPTVLAIAAMIGAWRLRRAGMDEDPEALDPEAMAGLSVLVLVWGAGWWALTAVCEVARFVRPVDQAAALLLVAAGTAAAWTAIAARVRWVALAGLCLGLMPAAALVLAQRLGEVEGQVLADLGWLGWLAVIAVHLLSLRRLAGLLPAQATGAAHVVGCWVVLAVLMLELRFLLDRLAGQDNAWGWLGWALVPSAYLLVAASERPRMWPLSTYAREYRAIAAAPVAALLFVWIWTANALGDGDAAPLMYLPLINPLELGLLVAVFATVRWAVVWLPRLGAPAEELARPTTAIAGATLFAMLTGLVMRSAHHWGGVRWDIDALLGSMLVQAGLSIAWTLVALGLMISGHVRGRRVRWTVGAVLTGVVVVKLFFVELGNSGGLARIVSFIAVGVLLLIVGYFAPRPPAQAPTQGGPQA